MAGNPYRPVTPEPESSASTSTPRWGIPKGLRILLDLEPVIVYALAVVTSMIGMVVWGITKIGRGQGALFENFQWLFGTAYGILVGAALISLFAAKRKWRGVVFVLGAWFFTAVLECIRLSSAPMNIDRFFGAGAMLAAIAAALFVHSESEP